MSAQPAISDDPTSDLALRAIGQIALTVTDVPRATAFYRDALGLRSLPIPAPPSMAFFECGGVRLMLSLPEGGMTAGGGTVLYFKVANIQDAHRRLSARGVPFVGEPHLVARMADHELWMAFFRDPDGNALAMMSEQRA